MTRRSLLLHAALVVLAGFTSIGAVRSVRAADAPPPAAPEGGTSTGDITTVAAGLEAPEAAVRERSAETLGTRYPAASIAVPVLLEAASDEDPAVRRAAVRALQLLGRRGQEDAARALTALSPAARAFYAESLPIFQALGESLTVGDFATVLLRGAEANVERDALYLLAMSPVELAARDFVRAVAYRDATGCMEIARARLGADDPATARAAAATVALLGRAAVAAGSRGTTSDGTESSPSLLPLLSSTDSVVGVAGFLVFANGAPHGDGVADRAVEACLRIPAPVLPRADDPSRSSRGGRGIEVSPFVESGLGRAAVEYVVTGFRRGTSIGLGAFPPELRVQRELLESHWKHQVALWTSDVEGNPIDTALVYAVGRDARFAGLAAPSVPDLFRVLRAHSAVARQLLDPTDPSDPGGAVVLDDPVPADTDDARVRRGRAFWPDPVIALAWLALVAPAERAPASLKAHAARVIRRALVAPNRMAERRAAAAVVADLGCDRTVPATTLLASLAADGTRRHGPTEVTLLRALAVCGVASRGIGEIARYAVASESVPEGMAPVRPHIERVLAGDSRELDAEIPLLRRLAAVDALGAAIDAAGRARARDLLALLAKDPDARVRYRAAKALRRLSA